MDKYFDKLREENYNKYVAPFDFAENTLRIADAFMKENCERAKQKYTGLYDYQKDFILNLAKHEDFVAFKPRCCGATYLLASHIANKIISNEYSDDTLNIFMVFANAALADEFSKKLKQCLYVANYKGYHKRFSNSCYETNNICIKFHSAKDQYSLCATRSFPAQEVYFDEYAFMNKDFVKEICMVYDKAKKTFITTPDTICDINPANYVTKEHSFQNIRWYDVPRYTVGGLWAYKTKRVENQIKENIENLIKDGWTITSPAYNEFKKMLGKNFFNELNDIKYGREEKN
jgi:hypothetical protein